IDLNDNEPFSQPGFAVDDKGVAQGTDEQLAEKVENIVNNMQQKSGGSGMNCEALSVELPSVHFDKDKYNIKPEYYAHLYEVAQRLLTCPEAKILARGMADKDDNTKYNEQLSYNRVDAVIDYLTSTYGLDRNRFIVKYDGEAEASGRTSSEQYLDRKVDFKLVEDETGDSNPSAPHPGMKAGKAK
ncbi:MAG: OmpA family protein, partial [Chitinophagales bacterium]